MTNRRVSFGLIADILDVLERHGHVRDDDQHAGRAIGLIGDLALIWEGTQDYPAGARLGRIPPSAPGSGALTLVGRDISTVLAALDEAAEYKRDRAETCADRPGQSCTTCSPACKAPRSMTTWLLRCCRKPMPTRLLTAASPNPPAPAYPPASTAMQLTGRPASDPPPEASRAPPPGRHAPDPRPRPGDKDLAETAEPYDLPFPDDYRPPRRPEYVIVVDQLRGWQPGQPPSLAASPNPTWKPNHDPDHQRHHHDQRPHAPFGLASRRPARMEVSWLPGPTLDRNTAITAMILADTIGEHDLHEGHRLWPHIQGWAAELGLTGPEALAAASRPPDGIHHEHDDEHAGGQLDREAAD